MNSTKATTTVLERVTYEETIIDGKPVQKWRKESDGEEVLPTNPSVPRLIPIQRNMDINNYVKTQLRDTSHNAYYAKLANENSLLSRTYGDKLEILLRNGEHELWILQFMQI